MTDRTPSLPQAAPAVSSPNDGNRAGLLFGLAAYLSWGFIPLYFKQFAAVPPHAAVPPLTVLGHRIVWSVAFLGVLLYRQRQLREVARCLADRRTLAVLLGSTLMIAANWYTFIWAVSHNHVKEASFGYFVNPLVNVLLGVVVLKERLRATQVAAIALATAGVAVMSWRLGGLPVVSLVLAASFGVYGLLRKVAAAGPLVGLSVETLLLFPLALGYLLIAGRPDGAGSPDGAGWSAALTAWGPRPAAFLLLGGVVTAVPLLWFAAAARRLRLTTLGFLQYVAPTCQLLLAVLAFGEPFAAGDGAAFGFIWAAIGVFTADAVRAARRSPAGAGGPPPRVTTALPVPVAPSPASAAPGDAGEDPSTDDRASTLTRA